MGGSSLTAEVLSSLQAAANVAAPLSLAILDSTDPQQVADAAKNFPPEKSLYIVASKSGGTAEMMAAFNLFWKSSNGDGRLPQDFLLRRIRGRTLLRHDRLRHGPRRAARIRPARLPRPRGLDEEPMRRGRPYRARPGRRARRRDG
ncbi:hypothetical protein FBQ79_11425 [Anaerolineae bacterium AMX1]|nr:hypothetical protein [Anaerolineae bacterium AMX1]